MAPTSFPPPLSDWGSAPLNKTSKSSRHSIHPHPLPTYHRLRSVPTRSPPLPLPGPLNLPHPKLTPGFLLQPLHGVVPCQYTEGDVHGHGVEDVQTPLVGEGVAVDTQGEFDEAEYGSDLYCGNGLVSGVADVGSGMGGAS